MTDNKVIVVLGMHRSGTSALTRGLSVLSVELGDNLMSASEDQNPKGFFEDLDIYQLNEQILRKAGSAWHSFAAIDHDSLLGPEFLPERLKAAQILQDKLDCANTFAFKDPRVAILLPFWKCVLDDLEVDSQFIVAVRNPLEVSQSLNRRDRFDFEKGVYLWTKHLAQIVIHTNDSHRLFVDYANLVESPERELSRVADAFSLKLPSPSSKKLTEYTLEFMDAELRHHRISKNELLRSPAVSDTSLKLYNLVAEWCSSTSDCTCRLDEEFGVELERYLRNLHPVAQYLDRIESHAQHLSLRLAELNQLKEDSAQKSEEQLQLLRSQVQRSEAKCADLESSISTLEQGHAEEVRSLIGNFEEKKVEILTGFNTQLSEVTKASSDDKRDLQQAFERNLNELLHTLQLERQSKKEVLEKRVSEMEEAHAIELETRDEGFAVRLAEVEHAHKQALTEVQKAHAIELETRDEGFAVRLAEVEHAHKQALTEVQKAHAIELETRDEGFAVRLAEVEHAHKQQQQSLSQEITVQFQNERRSLESQISSLEQELKEKRSMQDRLQQEAAVLNGEIAKLQSVRTELTQKNLRNSERATQLGKALEEARATMTDQKVSLRIAKSANRTLKSELAERTSEIERECANEISDLHERIASLTQQLDNKGGEIERHQEELQKRSTEVGALQGELALLRKNGQETELHLNELRSALRESEDVVRALKVDLRLTKAESREIKSSTSWRITKPLRKVAELLQR